MPADSFTRDDARWFEDLIRSELFELRGTRPEDVAVFDGTTAAIVGKPCVVLTGSSNEPRVSIDRHELVGLCLSGGGIRSATFNLGLLEALASHGVLTHVDYLSTVSGGGYVGGWWMRWLDRQLASPSSQSQPSASVPGARATSSSESGCKREYRAAARFFPERASSDGPLRSRGNGTPEVWKLRRFSRFLAPRVGVFEAETGAFIAALLGSALPGIAAAASILWLSIISFALLAVAIGASASSGALALGAVTFGVLSIAELRWHRARRADPADRQLGFAMVAIVALSVLAAVTWGLYAHRSILEPKLTTLWPASGTGWIDPFVPLVTPTLAWLFAAAIAVLLRTVTSRMIASRADATHANRSARTALDRQISRLVLTSAAWFVACAIWIAGRWLLEPGRAASLPGLMSSLAAAAGSLAWVWKTRPTSGDRASTGGIWDRVKPMLPQALAWFAVFTFTAVLAGIAWRIGNDPTQPTTLLERFAGPAGVAALVLALTAWLFDPREVSLHSAYRSRIARAYLASFRDGAEVSEETQDDDVALEKFDAQRKLPIHLICCAANGLADDPVRDLNRGARSAVLSRLGLSVGPSWSRWSSMRRGVTLGEAITASAAAVDSNMGAKSKEYGAAVTFLLAALNVRLGIWVQRKDAGAMTSTFPGYLYLCELFGRTHSVDEIPQNGERARPPANMRLTDGGHFENLGLYELVRRHCRYIVCADAGQDGDASFDDIGNAIRKVRQDFGVEITLDLAPLKPDEHGISEQHIAVGDILYPDGDLGVLVLFKPTITGDEPDDVLQYRKRNAAFPHESTGDQFYDQAQWESYRRLGEHAGEASLHALMRGARPANASHIFAILRQEWLPGPAHIKERLLELSARCVQFERDCHAAAPHALLRQVFPEVRTLEHDAEHAELKGDEWFAATYVIVQVMQLMEDVWLACDLDAHYNHPLNIGWINYFHRWAYAPTFRALWPLLCPVLSPGARRFLQERFGLAIDMSSARFGLQAVASEEILPTLCSSWELWCAQQSRDAGLRDRERFFVLTLRLQDVGRNVDVQIGVARVRFEGRDAGWHHTDLYVAHGLWGSGFGGTFQRALVAQLADRERLWVALAPQPFLTNVGAVAEWNDSFQFYARNKFQKQDARTVAPWVDELARRNPDAQSSGAVVLCLDRTSPKPPEPPERAPLPDVEVVSLVDDVGESVTIASNE